MSNQENIEVLIAYDLVCFGFTRWPQHLISSLPQNHRTQFSQLRVGGQREYAFFHVFFEGLSD